MSRTNLSRIADMTLEREPADQPLHSTVRCVLEAYFRELDGELPEGLYQLVIREVERPLLETVMEYCHGNQSRASDCLGINRGTLRKKLRDHGII